MDPRGTTAYKLSTPLATHFRKATCAEVNCKHYLNGWQIQANVTTPLGQRQVQLIEQAGRHYKLTKEGALYIYRFEPGQRCFKEHKTKSDKPALYIVRQGTNVSQHTRPELWVEDFQTHLDKIKEQ